LPSYIRVCPRIQLPVSAQWSQRLYVKVQGKMMHKDMHDVYIWANYSVSSYSKFIPICWNVLIWLKYYFMHIFMHHLSFETKIFASWTKATLFRIYFRNLSVQKSFLQYKSQCLEKVNVKYVIKRLWHAIFHI
jgi:hypothetical protein